ncbi:NADH dehydrogenase [ubiquinone] iron-sulfur protein 6, mitochondrial-like [Suncus etruscus]|uniref:NADH dehydrogenase [ubiquinone] iron-sulfur protein 6, mitochondrial-like n=1 Tax=Suncus etruscus TaxID=109475 RepID=UPI00211037D2|nr:NADH dehydrogenase [ubiquinone] iron-sulfur protein 6, mitochondrial-like [Suncus etruscus]
MPSLRAGSQSPSKLGKISKLPSSSSHLCGLWSGLEGSCQPALRALVSEGGGSLLQVTGGKLLAPSRNRPNYHGESYRDIRGFGVRTARTGEKVTHIGQAYDGLDYRKIRFVGWQKEVNENFAIDLIAEQPVSEVGSCVVSCDGGGGALGHPRVFINLDKETKTGTCGYCGLQFRQELH